MRTLATATIFLLLGLFPLAARATPSLIIATPSPDTQPALTVRGDAQIFIRTSGDREATSGPVATNQRRDPGVAILGADLGLPQIWKLRSEVGIDYVAAGSQTATESPPTLHAKLVIPELAFGEYSPALAVGISNYDPSGGRTSQNMAYGLFSETIRSLGRLSAGAYHASEHVVGPGGTATGALLSLDRLLSEKLWLGVDYISGKNLNSGVSGGLSYAFSTRAALMVGYDWHNARQYAGSDTVIVRTSFTFL